MFIDDIIDLILTIIFEGAVETTKSKRVPLALRIIIATILLSLFFGLFGLVLYGGIKTANILQITIGSLCITGFTVWVIVRVKMYKNK